jgi:prophage antirepressor-like protein
MFNPSFVSALIAVFRGVFFLEQKMQVQVFNFDNHAIRTVKTESGETLFVGKDVCDVLKYTNQSKAMNDHCKGVTRRYPLQTAGGVQEMRVLTEPDLYRLIIGSTLPAAQKFEAWVFEEVLPTIRKTGKYEVVKAASLPNFANPAEAARAWALEYEARIHAEATKAEIGNRREATAMNTASQATKKATKLEIELDKSKEYATVKRMEMLYHGTKFNWRLLKSTAIDMEVPPIDVFDANYGKVNAYHASVWLEAYAVAIEVL